MRFSIIAALLIIFFSISNAMCQETAPALKDNTFVMAITRPENDYIGKWWRLTYAEIFRRLGIKIEFRHYPLKRASIEADAGNAGGEPARPHQYADEHPNLIRIEEFIFNVNYSAFAVLSSIPDMKGWDSLKGTDYRVEYRNGMKMTEDNLPKVVRKENLSYITEPAQGLKKLISGRTDLFVDDETGVITLLQTPEFRDSGIRSVGVMGSARLYPYLHKKHGSLAPQMAEVIKTMKAEGLIEQYRMTVDKEFGVVRK